MHAAGQDHMQAESAASQFSLLQSMVTCQRRVSHVLSVHHPISYLLVPLSEKSTVLFPHFFVKIAPFL